METDDNSASSCRVSHVFTHPYSPNNQDVRYGASAVAPSHGMKSMLRTPPKFRVNVQDVTLAMIRAKARDAECCNDPWGKENVLYGDARDEPQAKARRHAQEAKLREMTQRAKERDFKCCQEPWGSESISYE